MSDFYVDPYVLGVIRLAERRGLLTGDLSTVQEWMMRLAMFNETVEEDRDRFDQRFTALRAALVSPDYDQIRRLFPEFFEQGHEAITEDEDLSDTTGTWSFEQSVTTTEEIEEVLRGLGQTGRATLDDLPTNGKENPWL